ncbi:MAG: NusG domain II-containing protein [Bullifex sp.]
MKKADWILIPLILIISILPLFSSQGDSSVVVIKAAGKTYRYSANQNQQISVPGVLGDTLVEIKEGKVRILSSPCPNHTCMRGSISRYPESLVCLPNDVIIQIKGEGETDAVTF